MLRFVALDLTAGSPEWRAALARVIEVIRAHGSDSYGGRIQAEMQYVVDASDPFEAAALDADATATLVVQLALALKLAMADYAHTLVEFDQILEWAKGALEMHSGAAQAEQGGLDDLLGRA